MVLSSEGFAGICDQNHLPSDKYKEALESAGGRITGCEGQDKTPLHYAAHKNAEAVRFILSKGVDPNIPDERGLTPLHYSIWSGNLEATTALLKAGADPNLANELGETPVQEVLLEGNKDLFQILVDEGGMDVSKKDTKGRNLIHHAASAATHNKHIIEALSDMGVSPTEKDYEGNTPLHYALSDEGNIEVLLNLGAKINETNDFGETILHRITTYEYYSSKAVRYLVEEGADVRLKDGNGRDFFDLVEMLAFGDVGKYDEGESFIF